MACINQLLFIPVLLKEVEEFLSAALNRAAFFVLNPNVQSSNNALGSTFYNCEIGKDHSFFIYTGAF